MNPDERLPGMGQVFEDLTKVPPGIQLPPGIDRKNDAKKWYAQSYTTRDGRTFFEFYQRGAGGGPGQPDPVYTTVEGPVNQEQKERYDKEKEKEAKPDPTVSAPPSQPNIVSRNPDGSLSTTPNPNYTPSTAATAAKPPETKDEGGRRYVWKPNPGGPNAGGTWEDVGPAPLTSAERAEADRNKPTSGEERGAVPNRPGWSFIKRSRTENGNTTTTTVYVGPDGQEVGALPAEPKPGQVIKGGGANGEDVQAVAGPDGRITYQPIPGAQPPASASAVEPSGAPKPSGRLGEAAADLQAYDEFLNAELRRPGTKLTAQQADKLREARRNFWKTALEEQQGIVNTQSTAYGQQVGQRGQTLSDQANRRSNATQIATAAENNWLPLAEKMGGGAAPTAGLAAAIRRSRVNAQNFVTMGGANQLVPEIQQGPALAAVNGMPLPGGAPTMTPGFNPRPNAIGVGSIGNVPAPALPAGAPAVAPPAPPAQNAGMGAGEPPARGNLPAQPSPQAALVQPSPYFLAGSSRGHAYDPTSSIQAMIADPRLDNAAVRAAVQAEYPDYPIDDLLGAA